MSDGKATSQQMARRYLAVVVSSFLCGSQTVRVSLSMPFIGRSEMALMRSFSMRLVTPTLRLHCGTPLSGAVSL